MAVVTTTVRWAKQTADTETVDSKVKVQAQRKQSDGSYINTTSFNEGETAYFRLYMPRTSRVVEVKPLFGTVTAVGSGSESIITNLSFDTLESQGEDANKATIDFIADGGISFSVLYGSAGSLSLQSDNVTVVASNWGLIEATATYDVYYRLFSLSPPNFSDPAITEIQNKVVFVVASN